MLRAISRATAQATAVAAVALVLLGSTRAAAQTGGTITGVVKDTQGGVLPGATITVRNADSGVTRTAISEGLGDFRVPGLPPGRYNVVAEMPGFETREVKGQTLVIGAELKFELTLGLSGLEENLTVTGVAPVIETTKSEVAQVVTQQQIQTLPVNNRQALTLALLLPGTSQDGTRARKVNANVGAGGGFSSSAFLVDGVSNQQTSAGEPRQDFPQGAIQEFRVNISQAAAEFGGTTGGVVTIVTKSGTNTFTGETFEYFRDKSLNAMNKFEKLAQETTGAPKPPFRRNQFGLSLGGPLVQNRAHFFAAMDFTETDTPFTVSTGKPELYSSVEGVFSNAQYRRMVFGRGDVQISPTQTAFVRWGWERDHITCETCGAGRASFSGSSVDQRRHSLAAGHSWVVGRRSLNEFHFQWAPFMFLQYPPGTSAYTDPTAFPADRFSPMTAVYQFPSMTYGTNTSRVQKETWWEFRDDFSTGFDWGGSHALKFGGASVRGPNQDDSASNSLGTWQFSTDQPFDPNDPSTIAALSKPQLFTASLPQVYRNTKNSWLQAYVQDEYRPGANLTLNFGLRYDLQYDSWNQNMDLSTFPRPLPYIDPKARKDHNNFGPRAGFAYDLRGNGATLVRGGYGRYYRYIFGSFGSEQSNLLQASIRITNPSYPDPYGGRSPLDFASTAPPNINIVSSDIRNPQADAFNMGFSQTLTSNVSLHVDAIYNHTTSDTLTTNINTPDPVTRVRPLPEWGRIVQSAPLGEAKYRALMMRLDKRFADRYMYLVSYTLSKSEGNLGGITQAYNPELDWGPADNDRRHMLVSSGAVLLPGDVTLGAVWTLRSKMPFSALAGTDIDGDSATTDYVPGTSANQGNRSLDLSMVNAWRAQNGRGPIPASQIENNNFNSVDLRASKTFRLHGSQRVEAIAQLFNVFGRDNLLVPGGSGSYVENALSDSFGRILSAQNRQQAELAVRFTW
ncbi:MAG: carboxypeptidase regulatory-like domain-containing protein [Vicinamibacterales bacterium]